MLKLTFTKTPGQKSIAYGQSWTHTVDEPDADFMREYDNLSPRGQFVFEYGWKQKLSDGMADVTNEAAFIGQLDKNRDAVVNGTVRSRDTVVKPVKTPIEREIEKLATKAVNEAIAGGPHEKMPHDKKLAYIELYAETHDEELRAQAKLNLAGTAKVRAVSADDLAALFAAKVKKPEESAPKGKK